MTLHYHGPEYGYVDSNDREELAAIARELDQRNRERRVEWRIGRELTPQERFALYATRAAYDRLEGRARMLRRGFRIAAGRP